MSSATNLPRILAVLPTVHFVRRGGDLWRAVDVQVLDPGGTGHLRLRAALDGRTTEADLGSPRQGETTHRIFVPDATEEKPAVFRLLMGGTLVHELTVSWRPGRHWVVHVVQMSHFDPGYTDLPSNVLDEYLQYLDEVVEWCEQTRRWPEEARFRYVVEQAWIAWHYVANRPTPMVERFARLCRAGQIEVSAFWANMASDLLGAEEAARLLYPAFELKRRLGIPIRTAQHNDVPGMAWSLATVLADVGVRWLVAGVPDYFSARYVGSERADAGGGRSLHRNFDDALVQPRDCPVAYRWEAQDGRSVLVVLHRQGAGGDTDTNLASLPAALAGLEAEGYPYDIARYGVRGGRRDNAPPRFAFAETIRAWNERWAYPRLAMSTDSAFCTELEGRLPGRVPVHRGHWPDTDYPLGATSTAEDLGVSRRAKEMLVAGERLAAVASRVSGYAYPRDRLSKAYIDALSFDEHAWGLSTPFGWADGAHRREKSLYAHHAAAAAHDVVVKAVNVIADRVGLDGEGWHILVFNALEHARTDMAEVPFRPSRPCSMPMHSVRPPEGDPSAPYWVWGLAEGRALHDPPPEWSDGRISIVDASTGEQVPHQLVRAPVDGTPARFSVQQAGYARHSPEAAWTLQFLARDVPGLGYRAYRVAHRSEVPSYATTLRVTADTLENEFYRVVVDAKTGAVRSILDKELDLELVDPRAEFGVNELFARGVADGRIERMQDVAVESPHSGPICARLLVRGSLAGAPEVAGEIVLYDGLKRIDFLNRVLKDLDGTRAYFVAFPFRVPQPRFRFDTGMHVVRPVEDQFPGTTTDYCAAQRWVSIEAGHGEWSLAWSAREAPLAQLGGNWPDYVSPAHHGVRPHGYVHSFLSEPEQFSRGHIYSYLANNNFLTNFAMSQPGPIHCTYSITSSPGASARTARLLGAGFCSPLEYALIQGPQAGRLPAAHSFCSVNPPNVLLSTIKQAEDGNGTIIRLLETEGLDAGATVDLPFLSFKRALRTNLVEEGGTRLEVEGSRFAVHLGPWCVATVRLL